MKEKEMMDATNMKIQETYRAIIYITFFYEINEKMVGWIDIQLVLSLIFVKREEGLMCIGIWESFRE
jgi:hypothetical protein